MRGRFATAGPWIDPLFPGPPAHTPIAHLVTQWTFRVYGSETMSALWLILLLAAYFALMRFVLPRFGVPT